MSALIASPALWQSRELIIVVPHTDCPKVHCSRVVHRDNWGRQEWWKSRRNSRRRTSYKRESVLGNVDRLDDRYRIRFIRNVTPP